MDIGGNWIIVCKCGKANQVGSLRCIRCENPIGEPKTTEPYRRPGESDNDYLRRCGPFLRWREKR